MRQPHRDELRVQTKTSGFRICYTREVLEADESDPSSIYDKLAGISCSDADHKNNVDFRINLEKIAALIFSVPCESDDVHPLEHRAEISTSGKGGGFNDLGEMRTVGLDDVIGPVRFEETTVVVEVAEICRDAIGAVQDCEEIGQQVDQHQQPGSWYGVERDALKGCEKILLQEISNKSDNALE
jgi:hypothetical protein